MSKIGVSQKAVIFNQEGKFLVLLRGASAPSNPLKWDLPGGDIDYGEDPMESILREIQEETGLETDTPIPFDVAARESYDKLWFVTIAYKTLAKSDKVKISWEHDEYRWVNKKEFAALPAPPKIVRFISKLED